LFLGSAAGEGVLYQVVDVVEGDFVDALLDLVEAGRFAFEKGPIGCSFLESLVKKICSGG